VVVEQVVGIGDSQGHQARVNSDGSLNVVSGVPEGANFYVYSINDVPGVAAANNFLSVFNPLTSGKTVIFYLSNTVAWAGAATTATVSMRVLRTTAASGGSLVTASAVAKFVSASPSASAEVRTGNPTATLASVNDLLGTPPAITSAGAGVSASAVSSTPGGASFVCVPGEGIVWRTASGDVDQLWNFQVVWAEV
jgi:hypothetical protein